MSRKISLALAAGAVAVALSGLAGAEGPAWGTTPTTSYERPVAISAPAGAADESCFPAAASECGPALGEAPTTTFAEGAVGATGMDAAGGSLGTVEVQTPGPEQVADD
jgi:hypothetical protein